MKTKTKIISGIAGGFALGMLIGSLLKGFGFGVADIMQKKGLTKRIHTVKLPITSQRNPVSVFRPISADYIIGY